ncbi:MAG: hypothetical protein KAG34_05255 [Cocleimonas sp.]|nr:hypothetical protein [Cocleimonas sp.]
MADVGLTGAAPAAAAAGGGDANSTLDTNGLLAKQTATQNKAMAYQTASTDLQTKFQMHSAAEKNRAAISTSVSALANQQSQALSRA